MFITVTWQKLVQPPSPHRYDVVRVVDGGYLFVTETWLGGWAKGVLTLSLFFWSSSDGHMGQPSGYWCSWVADSLGLGGDAESLALD